MTPTAVKPVEIEIVVHAAPETVFQYLTDPVKRARWIGIGGTWDARPGQPYELHMRHDLVVAGTFVEVSPPRRLVFSWGWTDPDAGVRPGTSTVEFTLEPHAGGTLVRLVHSNLPSRESAERHSHGWTHYLDRLAIAATGGDPGYDKLQEVSCRSAGAADDGGSGV